MANRESKKQSDHDNVVYTAKSIYEEHGKNVWINPGSTKNKTWSGQYIDVIATENKNSDKAWVIEIETEDSVSSTEAKNQWEKYDKAFTQRWHLAVPVNSESEALKLVNDTGIEHCKVITWKKNNDGTFTFWGLPGL